MSVKMDLFFGLVGFVGMLVFGIMGVVAYFKKKGSAKKNFIFCGVSFIMFAFGLAIAPDPEGSVPATTEVKAEEVKEERLECDKENVTKIANQKKLSCEEAEEHVAKAKETAAKEKEEREAEEAKLKAEQEKEDQEAKKKAEAEAKAKAEQEAKLAAEKKAKEEAEAKKKAEQAKAQPKYANAIVEMNPADVKTKIESNAKSNWPEDYVMQNFEIGEQTDAYNRLLQIKIDSKEKQGILDRAFSNWRYDFLMIEFEYNEQVKAMEGL